jgi:predicted thioesterase
MLHPASPYHVTRLSILATLLFAILSGSTGCESQPKPGEVPVGFDVTASHPAVLAGESVTFTATSINTYGRDTEIRWETTGGEMEEVDGDRVRRVRFDEAGRYKVSADLLLEGKRVATDILTIRVGEVQ